MYVTCHAYFKAAGGTPNFELRIANAEILRARRCRCGAVPAASNPAPANDDPETTISSTDHDANSTKSCTETNILNR
jgi:hypothetical protein